MPDNFRFGFKVTDAITVENFPNLPRLGVKAGQTNRDFFQRGCVRDGVPQSVRGDSQQGGCAHVRVLAVLRTANSDRINGWAEILQRLGDPDANIRPTMFVHRRCARLLECLPILQHDPHRPEDVLKVDADEEGIGGDDAADCCRYLVATKTRGIALRKLAGV